MPDRGLRLRRFAAGAPRISPTAAVGARALGQERDRPAVGRRAHAAHRSRRRPDPALQPALAAAADQAAVVYLAPPPDTGTTDPRLESLLAQIEGATPAVFVYISTTGVYGDAGGALVDEFTPVAPANDRSRRRVAAESTAQAWCAARGVRCVILRVPGIYGPNRLPLERLQRREPALREEDAGPGQSHPCRRPGRQPSWPPSITRRRRACST